ncbi:MAG: hypothetical protein AAF573_20905 [Bacteroidota bacterium]
MWYLNNVAKEWDALIEDEYESVLPLIWQPKLLNTKEIYVPQLVRSTGIYSVNFLSKRRVNAFLEAIPKQYQNIEIALNEGIAVSKDLDFEQEQKQNLQLLLNKDYESLELEYSDETNDLILKATKDNLTSNSNIKPEVLADFYKNHTPNTLGREEKFHALQRIMYNALHRGIGFASGIQNEKGDILAADFFIFSHGKMMSLIGTVSEKGLKSGAHHLLIDRIIQTNAARPMVLDFNNNEDWVKGFGAKPARYFQIKRKKGWRRFL